MAVDHTTIDAAVERWSDDVRKIGLYVDRVTHFEQGDQQYVTVECLIGDIALADRTQHPDQHATDRTLRTMEIAAERDRSSEFADKKLEMFERLRKGLPIIDTEDPDAGS